MHETGATIFVINECRDVYKLVDKRQVIAYTWYEIARKIEAATGLYEVASVKNSYEHGAFGMTCFTSVKSSISQTYPCKLLGDNTGLVVRMDEEYSLLFVHYPVDFANKGNNHHGVLANRNALKIAEREKITAIVGDMNLLEHAGDIMRGDTANSGYKYAFGDKLTFYGSFCDIVAINEFHNPVECI